VYHGIKLPNGWFAFGTYRGGAVVINSQGDVIQYIGKEQGIQDETVWHITLDDQDNLWLALNNGISYSAIKSPITSWDVTMGIQGVLQSVNEYDGILYVTTNAGTFYKENNIFHRVKGILNLSWDITNVTSSDTKVASLVATGDGIYQLNGKSASLIKNGNVPTFRIYQSKYHPNIVYLGLYDGLGVAAYEKGEWKYLGRFEGVAGRVYSVTEDNYNNLWFTSWSRSIVRAEVSNPRSLIFNNKEDFSNLPNNPNIDEDTKIVLIGNELKVSSTKGLSYFDTISMTFKPDYSLGSEFAEGEKGVRIFLQDSIGNLWFESYDEMHSRAIERAVKGDGEELIRIPNEFNEIPKMIFYGVNVQNDNIVWIAGADGLYRFDPTIRSRGIKIPHVLIRKVFAGQKQLLFGGAFALPCNDGYYLCTGDNQSSQNIPQLPYKLNTVSFHFSSPFFGQKDKMQFSFMLEGYDEDWSEWSPLLQKEYTNLPYGSYKFMVKTLSVYDVESSVTSYSFEIERPWYWHPLVFFMYFLLLLIIVALSVAVKTRMLKASNLKLQGIVDQRTNEMLIQQRDILGKTEELIQQKEEIETQRDILQHQSLKTSASIQYALTIQQAILPERKILDNYFENFLIYKPKDVVSGDFYWFSSLPSKVGKGKRLFIAVVDCTGHGVPGAFMSMIGSRMLSEIVNERKIYDPAAILTELDKMLDQVLHHDSSNNFDGMDVCLCAIDQITPEQYLVTFAGANRLVSYYKQGSKSITSIRGNRKSIGGFYPNIDNAFENHLIDMASGDTLFLYSDGIIDQNNQFDKKFTSSRLNTLFMANIEGNMDKMGNTINSVFTRFVGDTPQRDDITLVGIRLK
jgi:serine phosphatase RsbU (regulator of sigma subunit)